MTSVTLNTNLPSKRRRRQQRLPPRFRRLRPLPPRPRSLPARRIIRQTRNRIRRLARTVNNPRINNSTVNNMRRPGMISGPPITQAGMSFLKCAFAPPDFTQTQVQGIPDAYRGQSLLKKHRYNGNTIFTSSSDYYIILAPVPGVAYFTYATAQNVPPAALTSSWVAVNYSDFSTLFPSAGQTTDIVNSFRAVSNHIELICTQNQMSWSGSIQAWRLPLRIVISSDITSHFVNEYTITGLAGTTSTNSNRYVGNFFDGFFGGCYNAASTFGFTPILENQTSIPINVQTSDFGQLAGSNYLTGLANDFDSLVVRISGMSANQTAIIRTWACYEYTVNPQASVYEYCTVSPPEDHTALAAYRELALALPLGVPASMNADFWKRVLAILRTITGAAAFLPGPYGTIARGANLITTGISSF